MTPTVYSNSIGTMSVETSRTRILHSKRSFGKYPKIIDSPAYDAYVSVPRHSPAIFINPCITRSEEDNDPLTDDAKSSVSVPVTRHTGSHLPRSSHSKHPVPSPRVNSARHQLAYNNVLSDSDGVDGDIESTTVNPETGPSHKISHNYHLYKNSTSSISTLGTLDPSMTGITPHGNGARESVRFSSSTFFLACLIIIPDSTSGGQ